MYEEKQTFDVLKGTVPDFKSDVKLAITLNGEETETIPEKTEDTNYEVTVTCDNGAEGKWNYSKWNVEVNNFKKGTKCDVAFQTSEKEMPDDDGIKVVQLEKTLSIIKTDDFDAYYRIETFDFSNIEGYQTLSAKNFVAFTDCDYNPSGNDIVRQGVLKLDYDKNTGIVTIQYQFQTRHNALSWSRGFLYCYCFYY